MKLHKHFYVAIIILACSATLGEVYFRWGVGLGAGEATPLNQPLNTIPETLSPWKSIEVKMEPNILMKIGSKDLVRRTYYQEKPVRKELQFYAVYFGGVRGTAPHSPDACMPGGGWHNIQSDIVTWQIPGFGEKTLRVHQDIFEHKSLRKRIVVWWEYIHGQNVANRTLQRLMWALPTAVGGKRGSVLQVQISMEYDGDQARVLEDIRSFMDTLGPHLEAVLPAETDEEAETPAAKTETKK